ncbi:MAG: acylphosphatase [Thermoplasmata archaeon]|nr:acylphosphatase [Thermoplasmata archaeon]
MKKVKLTIRGDVQDVGFRLCLLKEAQKLSIPNFFADNLSDEKAVIALVGGKDKVVDEYVEVIKGMRQGNPTVIEVDVEEYKGSVRAIGDYVDYLHTEQLIKGVVVIESLRTELGTKLDTLDSTLQNVGQQFADSVSAGFRHIDQRIHQLPKKVADEVKK